MDVACIGLLVADIVGKPIDKIPEKNRLVLFDTVEMHTGGCAANTGRDLAQLGLSVSVGGMVGNDLFGKFMLEQLSEAGLDTAGIAVDPVIKTSVTFAMISSEGDRRFLTHLGGNDHYTESNVRIEDFKGAKILHIGGCLLLKAFDGQPMANVLRRAKEAGMITSVDTVFRAKTDCFDLLKPSFPYMDIFIPSIEEAEMITGMKDIDDIIGFFEPFNIPIVGVKLGEKGCYVKQGTEALAIPAFDVPAVDATGAGDAFFAGFLYARLQGWDLEKSGRFGNAVAGCGIGAMGATAGVTSVQDALDIMNNAPVKKVPD